MTLDIQLKPPHFKSIELPSLGGEADLLQSALVQTLHIVNHSLLTVCWAPSQLNQAGPSRVTRIYSRPRIILKPTEPI